jgi:uncharacterized linocin/CFP29 family protein
MPDKNQGNAAVDGIVGTGNGIRAMGSVAQRLLANGMNVNALRPWIGKDGRAYMANNGVAVPVANATLRKDEWKQYDQAILKAAQQRMVGIADLQSRGLTYNISNGLGTTVLEYEDQSDISAAQVSMDAVTRGQNDRPEFDINYLPLPIIHKDFQINVRALNASRTTGQSLDTTMAELAAFKVVELAEQYLFQGWSTFTYGGGTIYGYEDFTHANSVTLSTNWDASDDMGANILSDVRSMKQASINDRFYGPWVLYVPTDYETVLDNDYVSGYPKTIRERILEISGIQDVKVVDKLSEDTVILVQMTSDVVRLVNGLGITTVEWQTEGGMVFHYKIMMIQVPQLRADQNGRTGIVVLS